MTEIKEEHLLTIVNQVVTQHGCRIVEIDLERHILNIEGPEENQVNCAQALEQVLG
jgi:hypothetical protein